MGGRGCQERFGKRFPGPQVFQRSPHSDWFVQGSYHSRSSVLSPTLCSIYIVTCLVTIDGNWTDNWIYLITNTVTHL
jgi:hypothetical protein